MPKRIISAYLKSPEIIAFILTTILLAINGYHLGWDDQHLEIPLLKNLIDGSLYPGDYYITSLKENFTSFFYPLLAKVISVDQIPATYFTLYLVSRYFLIYWIYKLWLHISKDRFKAIACVLVFILMARVHEFLYRTFSHQEFALAIIFAGIYYFFKDRFILAAILLGLAANFHALYSLFPFTFMIVYLLWQVRRHGIKTLLMSGMMFVTCALPFILWTVQNRMGGESTAAMNSDPNWLTLFITSCPQNFFYPQFPLIPIDKMLGNFNLFYYANQNYIFLIVLFLFNLLFNRDFYTNKKAIAFCALAFIFLILCFIFTYLYPHQFFLDLNLSRNTQFLLFLLMGFTTILVIKQSEEGNLLTAFCFGILFTLLKYNTLTATASLTAMGGLMLITQQGTKQKATEKTLQTQNLYGYLSKVTGLLILIPCIYTIRDSFNKAHYSYPVRLNLAIIFGLMIISYLMNRWRQHTLATTHNRQMTYPCETPGTINPVKPPVRQLWSLRSFVIIPLCIFLWQFASYHVHKAREQKTGAGFWQMQRNWEDMQRFVQANTPKDAIIFVPYNMEMGGFRIQSERTIVASYRDCGIIGFNYKAAVEWRRRIADIEPFKITVTRPLNDVVQRAITHYNADYIVFMRYAAPTQDSSVLQRVYTNANFVLFKVNRS